MKWTDCLRLVGDEPVFASSLLLAGDVSPAQVRVQLSRWVAAGRLHRLRRGLYALAEVWRKVEPHPFVVANALYPGSCVSLQSALAYHGIIPEHVPVTTSVGPGRPERRSTPLGTFQLRYLGDELRFGYQQVVVATRQTAFLASPEKALLDLIHLTPGADHPDYLAALRLHHRELLDPATIAALARRSGKPKLIRAAELVSRLHHDGGD